MAIQSETYEQMRVMLTMQKEMNARVHPQWMEQGFQFLRAVIVEGTEAIEHLGWKWWKKQVADMEQFRMELVDIFHFALSDLLVKTGGDIEKAVRHLRLDFSSGHHDLNFMVGRGRAVGDIERHCFKAEGSDVRERLEAMIALAACRQFSFALFAVLLADAGMSMDELFKQYVAKNSLNFFRQDNGYQEGTYRKLWAGREDNEHLVELMADVDFSKASARDTLYALLQERYASLA